MAFRLTHTVKKIKKISTIIATLKKNGAVPRINKKEFTKRLGSTLNKTLNNVKITKTEK